MSNPLGDTVAALVTGGIGATIGGIVTVFVQVFSKRNEVRAQAADIVTSAADRTVTMSIKIADRLEQENHQLREAVLLIAELLEETLPDLDAPPEVMAKLRRAKRAAEKVA